MGKAGGGKIRVTKYFMSQHFGICAAPIDALRSVTVKEKIAWEGRLTAQTAFAINKEDLFGGHEKEGGFEAVAHYLPGESDQILDNVLAQRLGRANGLDCPGYRGIASIFFIGPSGTPFAGSVRWSKKVKGKKGAYWTCNIPYLPGVWIGVERSPKGISPELAMIPRLGTETYPMTTTVQAGADWNAPALSKDGAVLLTGGAGGFHVWDLRTRQRISTGALYHPDNPNAGPGDGWAIDGQGRLWMAGTQSAATFPQRWLFSYGTDGRLLTERPLQDGSGNWQYLTSPQVIDTGGGEIIYVGPAFSFHHFWIGSPAGGAGRFYETLAATGADWAPTAVCADSDGEAWVAGNLGNEIHFFNVETDHHFAVDVGAATVFAAVRHYLDDDNDHFVAFGTNGMMYFIDRQTEAPLFDEPYEGADVAEVVPQAPYGARSVFLGNSVTQWREYSLKNGALLRTMAAATWGGASAANGIYDSVNHSWLSFNATLGPALVWYDMDRGAGDANGACIVYEALTNTDWGMGSPSTALNVASFEEAAQTLFDEQFGISLLWTRQSTIEAFIQEVLDHILGVVFADPATGLLTLKLIRGDYDVGTLPSVHKGNARLSGFGRKLWGDIANEITVSWTNPETEQSESVTVHDLASIAAQGGIVPDSRNFYGVRSAELASRLGQRELRSAGAPLAACDAELNRASWQLRPGDVVALDWPEHGLDGVAMRVLDVNYGKPGDIDIKVSLIEDVFGLDAGAYVPPLTGGGWVDPSSFPQPMQIQRLFTLPHYVANLKAGGDGSYPQVLAGILATTDESDTFSYDLWSEVTLGTGGIEWRLSSTNNVLGHALLTNALDLEAQSTGVAFNTMIGQTSPEVAGYVIIGDAGDEGNEIALIQSGFTTFTLLRGIFDTVPRAWPVGTPVWFVSPDTIFDDPAIRSAGEEPRYKLLTRTSLGVLSLAAAPVLTGAMTERPWLPNRPGNVEIEGVAFNTVDNPFDATELSSVDVTWSNRNRLLEGDTVIGWTEANVTPEDGQTTKITILDEDRNLLATHDGLAGTSYSLPLTGFGTANLIIVRVAAERDDVDGIFESLQAHEIFVQIGGNRLTEEGDQRLTEEGVEMDLED